MRNRRQRELIGRAFASALLAHDAALDEHHDCASFVFVFGQAISSRRRQRLTLFEVLPISCFHVAHHVAHASLLLGKSSGADTDGDEGSNNQSFHVSSDSDPTRPFSNLPIRDWT